MDKLQASQDPKRKQGQKSQKPQLPTGEIKGMSENRYRFLFNSVKDGILLLDYDTEKIIDANSSITDLTGFLPESILGKEVWDMELFEDRKLYESIIKEIKNNGRTYVEEIPAVKKNGRPRAFEFVGNVYAEGKHKIIQCNIRRIKAQQQDPSRINEIRFQQISEGTSELIWEVDLNGLFTYVNTNATEILGYKPEELIGKKHFFDFFEPGNKEVLKNQIFKIFSHKGNIKNFINCNIHKKGHKICFSTNGFPILDLENNLTGYRGVDVDITAQLETEEALQQSEAKTRTILEAISTGIIIVDPETHTIVDVNAEAARLFGEQKNKIIGNVCHKYICPAEIGKCPATDLGQLIDNSERLLINTKGEEIPILKTVTQIVIGGKKLLLENFTDISKRKQAEINLKGEKERYKAITNAIPDLVFRLDSEGRYLDYKADEHELAVQAGDIIGKTNRELMPPEFADLFDEKIHTTLKTRKTQNFEYQLPVQNKGIRSYDARMVVSGKNEVITFVRDITEQRQSEKEIQKSEHRYRELFENSGTPIWEVDLSNVLSYLTALKEKGVVDLGKYFDENSDEVVRCVLMVKLLDANKELLNFLKVGSKEQALTGLLHFFTEESLEPAKKVILELSEGELKIDGEIPVKTFTNEIKHVIFRISVATKDKHIWAKSLISFIDITAKKRAEKALRESEKHLHQIMENVDSVFYMMSCNDDKLVYINSAYEKIWGQSTEAIMKDPLKWLDPIHEEDRGKAMKLFEDGEGEIQYRITLPDGTMKWIWDRMFPVLNEKGDIAFRCGMASDITESKNAEQILCESKAQLDEATKIAKLAPWEFDVENKMFKFNDQFYELLKTTAKKEGGYYMSSEDYVKKFLDPEGADLLMYEAEKAIETSNPDYNAHVDHRIKYRNGQKGYIAINFRIEKNQAGRTIRIYGIVQDITNRKRDEESLKLFRTLIDNSNDAIEVVDIKTGQYLDVNKKACSDLGYTREELLNLKVFDIDPNQTSETFESISKEFHHSGSMLLESQHTRKDGSIFPVEVNVAIVELERTYIIALVRDITERKHYEFELIKAKEKAEESDSLKSAFLANMSHEIRTPMNGILGFTELLKEPLLTGEEQKKYIDIIEKSGKRMLNIINDIISISKIESGQVEVSITETNINEQLEYIYLFFKKDTEDIKLDFSIERYLPKDRAIVKTDREKVYAVLINLVKNALKFTKEGSIKFGCEQKGEFLEFYVKDTGSGVPEEKREIIFERFRQGSEDINRDYEGAGLGLAICKGYLEMIGGKIWMYPNMYTDPKTGISHEKGSAFYFTIPMQLDKNQKVASDEAENVEKTQNQNKNLNVLIAEDDEVSLMYINKIAKDFANEILIASNGVEAVDLCKNNTDLNLILMDLKMPVMGGHEAVTKIREFNKDIIIIAQTAYGMTGDKEKAIKLGCNDYISKPINRKELIELINKYFE